MEMPINFIQQGWQCPVCGKVHAPWVSECDCHKISAKGTTTTNTDFDAQHASITVGFAEPLINKRANNDI